MQLREIRSSAKRISTLVSLDIGDSLEDVETLPRPWILRAPAWPMPSVISPFASSVAYEVEKFQEIVRHAAMSSDALIADSGRSAAALTDVGASNVRVIPSPVSVQHLHEATPSQSTENHLRRLGPPIVFLTLGPIMPDAGVHQVLGANSVLVTSLLPAAQMVVAGPSPLRRYVGACELYTREMNTDQTWIATNLTIPEQAALLRISTAIVDIDESNRYPRHTIEAMSFGIPVVGKVGTVLHEMAPDAGIFLQSNDGPTVLAEAMNLLATDTALRDALGQQARRVAAIFCSDDYAKEYERKLVELSR